MKTSLILLVALAMMVGGGWLRGVEPATTQVRGKAADELEREFMAAREQLDGVMPKGAEMLNASKRAEAAPKVIPLFKTMLGALVELKTKRPELAKVFEDSRFGVLSMMALFGDAQAQKDLQTASESKDPAVALMARTSMLLNQWWTVAGNAGAQGKILDEVEKMAKEHPSDADVGQMLQSMNSLGSSNRELKLRTIQIITDDLQGDQAGFLKEQVAAQKKMFDLEGKPLVIEGQTMEGKPFTSVDWKGKVVMVDFWATWCGPCVASLPEVKKMYATYHDKGFEIVGISNDRSVDDLKAFVGQDAEMKWPQLFDPKANGQWHALSNKYGVEAIPAMFIIDRKGVLRSVEGQEMAGELVPKLVEEK